MDKRKDCEQFNALRADWIPRALISAVIPARNEEASIARAVESVAAQPEIGEVIVVDDQSTDRTAEILRELARQIPKLKVLQAGELPRGWTGKNYAASIGASTAQGEWLLFTDADTYHFPGSARRVLSDAVDHNAVLVSYSPEQEMESFWERALIPVVYWRLAKKYPYQDVNDGESPNAAANGQYLLVRRDIYRAIGGHGAVASEILEDVALARRMKQAENRIYFATGQGIVRTRMYRSFRAMWEGWSKNLQLLMGGSWPATVGNLVVWLGIMLAPGIVGRRYLSESAWVALVAPFAFVAVLSAQYATYLRRNRYPGSYIRYFVPGLCLYFAARMASWWKSTRGSVDWKGRTYAARTP